jgi:DNA repair exonuclease SbcCD ATPase subunit
MEPETKTPLEEFVELYSQIKDKFEKLPTVLTKLSSFSDNIVKDNQDLKAKVKELEEKSKEVEKLANEAADYKNQLESVEEQMKGLREMYEEMTQERAKDLEIQELLAIYTVLFEKVFAANPHTKILLLLQGVDKEIWTRDELVKTTNFTPAAIIKALHDLRNNDIVELDESATEVKLIQKME